MYFVLIVMELADLCTVRFIKSALLNTNNSYL